MSVTAGLLQLVNAGFVLVAMQDGQVTVSMAEASLSYSWEYAGNAAKLVVTPLTDRCAWSSMFIGLALVGALVTHCLLLGLRSLGVLCLPSHALAVPTLPLLTVPCRCFLTLTQALSLGYGGNPYGPAGTGKTESVKALGLALGRQVCLYPCKTWPCLESVARL